MANANEEQICKARVLLVEDEPAVRNATQLLLTVEGYTVKAVSSLGEALAAVRRGEAVDLLITDYHLRDGETGVTVIAELRAVLGESLKALLVTGDTSSVIRRLPQDSNLRIISKPVNADEMLGLLEALLAAPSK
jgi:CheY-like chemotaxis protein